jgi:hypothetical protein
VPPEQVDEWRRGGVIAFFHYGYGKNVMLRYSFYVDSLRHNVFEASFDQPTLVFQGLRDATVDPRTVEAFAKRRPNVTLSLVDDDHQLAASLSRMWVDIAPFLGLAP